MAYSLSQLKSTPGTARPRQRVGRGIAAGQGKTSGRGTKGQRARTGGKKGTRARALRRISQPLPKLRGFTSLRIKPEVVNVGILERIFEASAVISPAVLKTKRLIRYPAQGVKILGAGALTKSFVFDGCVVSRPARKKILAVGGTIH